MHIHLELHYQIQIHGAANYYSAYDSAGQPSYLTPYVTGHVDLQGIAKCTANQDIWYWGAVDGYMRRSEQVVIGGIDIY